MADQYVSPNGNDNNSGSLESPWRTLDRAIKASGANVTVLPGSYAAPRSPITVPVTLNAPEPVLITPWQTHGSWAQTTVGGQTVWKASHNGGAISTQAVWSADGKTIRRIPIWYHVTNIETPDKWAAAVLGEANKHTRWGLHSTSSDLYLILPFDGSFSDPNAVDIWASSRESLVINAQDVTISGLFTVLGGQSACIRLNATAQRTVLDGLRIVSGKAGISVYAVASSTGWTYGQDHQLRNLRIEDSGTSKQPTETSDARQMIPWFLIKHHHRINLGTDLAPIWVLAPLNAAETTAIWLTGGAQNMVVEDCTFDGTFDGISHWSSDSQFDEGANLNLAIRRCKFKNHGDDSFDISRRAYGVTVEDCTFENVGTVVSPAPFFGTMTLRRCYAWRIGDQARIKDGTGAVPKGMVVKYGAQDGKWPQGKVTFEDSVFWTNTPTTRGIQPDGGDGTYVPAFAFKRTTIRVGDRVVDYGASPHAHPLDWFTFDAETRFSTSATSGKLDVQPDLKITLVPANEVDASYPDPYNGVFITTEEEDPAVIAELTKELEEEHKLRLAAEGQLVLEQARADALQTELDNALALAADRGDRIVAWKAARGGLEQAP